jgi:hypothetical protein
MISDFAQIPELQGRFALVSAEKFSLIISRIGKFLQDITERLEFDISNATEEQVRAIFYQNAPLSIDTEVYAVWPSNRVAIKLSYALFVEQYENLWFPSRDDVWITVETCDWLIEISHEEILTFLT